MEVKQPRIQEIGNAQTQVQVHAHRSTSRSKVFSWLGFILPFLWIIGAFATSKSPEVANDVETGQRKMTSTTVAPAVRSEKAERGWWRRWAYHPDEYVERCRLALGVTVPMAVVGGVVAAVVVVLT